MRIMFKNELSIEWTGALFYCLDNLFHLHSDVVCDRHDNAQENSPLKLLTHLEPRRLSRNLSRNFLIHWNISSEFSLLFKRLSRFINHHKNLSTRCHIRVFSFFVCVYLVCDAVRSAIIILWIRKGYINPKCLKAEVCNFSQRKQLLWYRMLDMFVATTHEIPEIHVLNALMSISVLAVTFYFTFNRDIQGQSSNAAVLYMKLLKCYSLHEPDKDDTLSTKNIQHISNEKSDDILSDQDDFDLDFDYNDFRLSGPSVKMTRWTIRKKTITFLDRLIRITIFSNVATTFLVGIGYLVLSLFFYWKINKAGITLEEEQLKQDFRPFVLVRTILSGIELLIKLFFENIYHAHFSHHMLCCIILRERLHVTAMQSKKISQYLINHKYIIKKLNNDNKIISNELCTIRDSYNCTTRYRKCSQDENLPHFGILYAQKDQQRLSIHQPELSTNEYQKLIWAALDENFRCIGAVRKELEDLRLHFMPFLSFELLAKVPLSVLYFSSFAILGRNDNSYFSARIYSIYIGLCITALVLPLIIMTGVVQKSVSLQ